MSGLSDVESSFCSSEGGICRGEKSRKKTDERENEEVESLLLCCLQREMEDETDIGTDKERGREKRMEK